MFDTFSMFTIAILLQVYARYAASILETEHLNRGGGTMYIHISHMLLYFSSSNYSVLF